VADGTPGVRADELWSCQRCSRVTVDAPRCAVSDVATITELRLCAQCRRQLRLDPFVIVEELVA